MPECALCGKPVQEDDAAKVVADWKPEEPGVFHVECWSAYEDGFVEEPDRDEPGEAPSVESSSIASDEASSDESSPEESSSEESSSDEASPEESSPEESSPEESSPEEASPSEPAPPSPSWRRKGVLVALGLLLGAGVAAVIVASTSGGGSPTRPAAVTLESSLPNSSSSDGLGAALGQAAPRLVGTSLDGSPLTISPGGGARHAVVFLAHWCAPCQREVREIVKLANRGQLDGLQVEAVVTATSPNRANYPPSTWLERERWPYPTLNDNASRTAANAYGITSIPTVVLVAENAEVVARLGNLRHAKALRTLRNFAAGR